MNGLSIQYWTNAMHRQKMLNDLMDIVDLSLDCRICPILLLRVTFDTHVPMILYQVLTQIKDEVR